MTEPIRPWPRPLLQGEPGSAEITLFVFASEPLDLSSPPSRARHGLPPGYDLNNIDLRHHARDTDPEWFDGFFSGPMRRVAEFDLPEPSALKSVYSIRYQGENPVDLGYLQATWGIAKWLSEQGATLVHNGNAITWHSCESVRALEPRREFDVTREIQLIFETESTEGFGHVMHTRGMLNFGQPDFVLFGAGQDDSRAAGALLNSMAERAALGASFNAGQTVAPRGLEPRILFDYEPEAEHPQVNLNNVGLCLNISGWGLCDL